MRKFTMFFLAALLMFVSPALASSPKAGDTAPDFSLTSIKGKKISLDDFKGKVVLMGMFHICVPCMNQAMEFEKVRESINNEKLVVIGVNTSGDSKQAVEDYLSGFPKKVNFPYLLDPEHSVHGKYIQRDMPTVVIIGSDGVIRARTPGVGADQLIPFLQKLLSS